MTRIAFIVFAFTFPVPVPYLIVAFLVVAIVIFIGAILLLRNTGKKKKANANKSGGAAWQPQGQQQGMPGGWNQQGMVAPADNAWGQQQPGAWAAQAPAQQQQQQPGAWGAQQPAQQPGAWAAQPPAQQQQQPGAWGAQQPAQQPGAWAAQPPAQQQPSPWGSPSSPSSNAANLPGGQGMGGGQPAWDATFAPQQSSAPSQDQWKQAPVSPVEQGASVWGMQNNNPAQQQAPTSYGGGNSGQSWGQANQSAQPADPWSTPSAQQSAPAQQGWGQPQSPSNPSTAGPAWQQGPGQGQGFGNPAAGNVPGGQVAGGYASPGMFGNNDNDKTMLRPSGPQGGLGMVRVEEGKEPGRVYEVRKEELSIGRSRESDIFLEDLAVSRLHAKIVSLGNGNYALKDEGSANGTKVNGQLVNKYQTYPLQEGDKIQLGQTVLVFARR